MVFAAVAVFVATGFVPYSSAAEGFDFGWSLLSSTFLAAGEEAFAALEVAVPVVEELAFVAPLAAAVAVADAAAPSASPLFSASFFSAAFFAARSLS